jgi:uncharacterized protein (DUF2236 family)
MSGLNGLLDLISPVIPGLEDGAVTRPVDRDGYFPAGSMIRHLHAERIVALSGVRALLMQACDPLAVVGFDRHSKIFDDPRTRLLETDRMMSRMYFGSRDAAVETGRLIQSMHDRVQGKTSEDYGPVPAGTPYSASDPDLMLWTLATLADSALVYYEGFIGSLEPDERQAYWSDYREIGRLLGMPDESMPETESGMREYVSSRLTDGSLHISGTIRDRATAIIFDPPFEGWTRLALTPLTEAVKLSSIGFLPHEIREMYGFSWDPARAALLRTSALQVRLAVGTWPDLVRLHPAARQQAA